MIKPITKAFFILHLALLIFAAPKAFASIEDSHDHAFGPFNTSLHLNDQQFGTAGFTGITYRSVKGAVSLRIHDDVALTAAFSYYVTLSIKCYTDPLNPNTVTKTLTPQLIVRYDPAAGTPYQAVATYNMPTDQNIYKADISVTAQGPVLGESAPASAGIIELSGTLTFDKIYPFNPTADIPLAVVGTFNNTSTNTASTMLQLSWDFVQGAEEYDLEWTTVDAGDPNEPIALALVNNNNAGLVLQAYKLFKNNATRITIQNQHQYNISLSFNDDYLVARVRQVQYSVDGVRLLGDWSYHMASGNAAWKIDQLWHSDKLNWQYSASYAEEGKKKEVISYFDGTLRNRQTVTLNNSDNVPIVQENVYDNFGRPMGSILPAPVKDITVPYLHYFPALNVNSQSKPYSYTDIIGSGSLSCEVIPGILKNTIGTSKYYSSNNNDFINSLDLNEKNKYIPDAQGYPIAVTQYTADNTGRISLQGGVGKAFQPGLTTGYPSHTTKYFYSKPDQWELDQLFGNDVGYAEHYSKNTVIDPNNQISITYQNASGKTIATALAGSPPPGMDSLVSKVPIRYRTSRILDPKDFVFDNASLKLSASTTYAVTATGPDTLTVNAEQLIYNFTQGPVTVCSNCLYDLNLKVVNACNPTVPVYTSTLVVGKIDTSCTANSGFSRIIPLNFDIVGEYYVSAELVLSKTAMENYLGKYITKGQAGGVIFKDWHFVWPYLNKIDFLGLFSDCTVLAKLLGSYPDFKAMFDNKLTSLGINLASLSTTEAADYNTWLSAKYALLWGLGQACIPAPCDGVKSVMLRDVSPGGQYALFDQAGAALEATTNVVSQNWRTVFPVKPATDAAYLAHTFTKADGSVSSANDAVTQLTDIVTYWNRDWADGFLAYHPEYCKYIFCTTKSTKGWDDIVKGYAIKLAGDVKNLPGASISTTYDYNNASWLLAIDPFFTGSGAGAGSYSAMQADLNNYSNAVLGYTQSTKSLTLFVDFTLYCNQNCTGTQTASNNCWDNCSAVSCRIPYRDFETYKNFYFQLKEKYYDIVRSQTTCPGVCPIGQLYTPAPAATCAGTDDFSISLTTDSAGLASTHCDSTKQSVTVKYNRGTVSTATYVYLFTSPEYASLVPTSLNFPINTTEQSFCIPKNVPLSAIQIKAVNCTGTAPPAYVSSAFTPIDGDVVQNPYGNPGITVTGNDYNISYKQVDGATWEVKLTIKNGLPPCPQMDIIGYATILDAYNKVYYFPVHIDPVKRYGRANIPTAAYSPGSAGTVNCPEGWTPPPTCTEAYLYKTSRFDFVTKTNPYSSDVNVSYSQSDAQLNKLIKGNCDAQADRWMMMLDTGINTAGKQASKDALRTALVKFCADNGDRGHIYGASTTIKANTSVATNPDYPNADFADVIKNTLGISTFTPQLNPWLFDGPGPFNVKPQVAAKVISRSEPSIVVMLGTLLNEQSSANYPGTLYDYMVHKYGAASMADFPPGDLDTLEMATQSCGFLLKKDITLPVFLQQGFYGAITGTQFDAALTTLQASVPGIQTSDKYNLVLGNYMNQLWGFSLGYSAWADFRDSHTSSSILTNSPAFSKVTPDKFAALKSHITVAVSNGEQEYSAYMVAVKNTFRSNYISTCAAAKTTVDNSAPSQYYHFTLYYYDQADNLIRTVPPEGVTLLTAAQISQVQKARGNDDAGYTYTGPIANADQTQALNSLSTTLFAAQGAIEMWLYNSNGSTNYHIVEVTPDRKWLFQFGIWAGRANIDIYPLTQNTASSIAFNPNSRHYRADISSRLPLNPFTHVVIQGPLLGSGTTKPQLYINGTAVTVTTGASPAADEGFEVKATASSVTFPDVITTLKHLRLYYHQLSAATIAANAANTHFVMADTPEGGWYRFNVPGAGSLTTAGPGTTNETTLFGSYPAHTLPTSYVYNTTNQVVQQNSPDGGTNRYWYDMLSRLVISQNDKQLANIDYSYTKYDALGRITEVGQKDTTVAIQGAPGYLDDNAISDFNNRGTNKQITNTYYDAIPTTAISGLQTNLPQNNLRKRVVASTYRDMQAGAVQQATYYNYDLDGNVSTLWQQINGFGTVPKRIDYEYDLISGKVNFVRYQDGQIDKFYYKYKYDAQNRLTEAWTGTMAIGTPLEGSDLLRENQRMDATYYYYLHGPLARMELGNQYGKVQGLDYAYTLQGWLKGVNSQSTASANDIGGDGIVAAGNPRQGIAKDAYAYSLGYYHGALDTLDYTAIKSATAPAMAMTYNHTAHEYSGQNLFNGNISTSTLSIGQFNGGAPVGYGYHYDQLNRLKTYIQHPGISGAGWDGTSRSENYKEIATYDGNGNILTYRRNGTLATTPATAQTIDELRYNYNRDANTGKLTNNRLNYIYDTVATSNYTGDLISQSSSNYTYDQIGNLLKDNQVGITNTDWNAYGKMTTIYKASGNIVFTYDAVGHRVSKRTGTGPTTYYVRDAQGNALATYSYDGTTTTWKEQDIYGSSRLGMWTPNLNVGTGNTSAPDDEFNKAGKKYYELSNHLGNVLATISDRRVWAGGNLTADVVTAQDYYPFGMLQPGRQYTGGVGSYRYGFNGKENDNDVGKGTGGEQDYGMRIYDTRVGRFLSVDPISRSYPWYTPYQFAGNSPIQAVDLDGNEPKSVVSEKYRENNIMTRNLQPDRTDPFPHKITYKLTNPTVELLSYLTGVSESVLKNGAEINVANNPVPGYNPKDGGGGITLPGQKHGIYDIRLTENFFTSFRSAFYGETNSNFSNSTYHWLRLLSHEVRHIPQIQNHRESKASYVSEFLKQYAVSGSHNGAPYEQNADLGTNLFDRFIDFTNTFYGNNSLVNLFTGSGSDKNKVNTLKGWEQDFSSYEELIYLRKGSDITMKDIKENIKPNEKDKKSE
jgi:RHS repeat-associated protein